MRDPICIGLDLAWSPNHPSGIAVIKGVTSGGKVMGGILTDSRILQTDQEISNYILQQGGEAPWVVVAVDAPLWVPNPSGQRRAETELNQIFRVYQAGAHPSNRQRLSYGGKVRGESLIANLAEGGFVYRASIQPDWVGRQLTEVYPHPAMVALFGLQRTLKYKAKPQRPWAERQQAWQDYQQHLNQLGESDPWLRGQQSLLAKKVEDRRGRALKNYEDQVDALMCAYIALYGLRWGSQRCRTFGDVEEGSIFTPIPSSLWRVGESSPFDGSTGGGDQQQDPRLVDVDGACLQGNANHAISS
ncbi:MAG: DUF429 domain-containing protein [Cyanobacteriota bacterium]|nr:DUF429 domain-containing protein [Cyanobacteriota bacterium]